MTSPSLSDWDCKPFGCYLLLGQYCDNSSCDPGHPGARADLGLLWCRGPQTQLTSDLGAPRGRRGQLQSDQPTSSQSPVWPAPLFPGWSCRPSHGKLSLVGVIFHIFPVVPGTRSHVS